jgi:hypothetical protein
MKYILVIDVNGAEKIETFTEFTKAGHRYLSAASYVGDGYVRSATLLLEDETHGRTVLGRRRSALGAAVRRRGPARSRGASTRRHWT